MCLWDAGAREAYLKGILGGTAMTARIGPSPFAAGGRAAAGHWEMANRLRILRTVMAEIPDLFAATAEAGRPLCSRMPRTHEQWLSGAAHLRL